MDRESMGSASTTQVIPDGYSLEKSTKQIPEGFSLVTKDEATSEPKQPKERYEAVETLKDIGQVYPTLEGAANFLTQIYGLPASGYAGLIGGIKWDKSWDVKSADKARKWAEEKLIYTPQTKRGQHLTEAAFYPFQLLHEAGQHLGDWVLEKTNSPLLAASAVTASQLAPIAATHLAKKVFSKPPPKTITPETTFPRELFEREFLKEQGVEPVLDSVDPRFLADKPKLKASPSVEEPVTKLNIVEKRTQIPDEQPSNVVEIFKQPEETPLKTGSEVKIDTPVIDGMKLSGVSEELFKVMDDIGPSDTLQEWNSTFPKFKEYIKKTYGQDGLRKINEYKNQIINDGKARGEITSPHNTASAFTEAWQHYVNKLKKSEPDLRVVEETPKIPDHLVELTPEETFIKDTAGIEGLKESTKSRKKPSIDPEDAAKQEFQKLADETYPEGVEVYHEAPMSALEGIIEKGLDSQESAENTNFGTIGKPSEFISSPEKIIVKFKATVDDLVPDMRYSSDMGYSSLLREHSGIEGSDVAHLGKVTKGMIDEIAIVKDNKVVEVLKGPDFKRSTTPTEAVSTTKTRVQLIKERHEQLIREGKIKKPRSALTDEQIQKLDDAEFLAEINSEYARGNTETIKQNPNEVYFDDLGGDNTFYGGIPFHLFAEAWTRFVGKPVWDNLIMTKVPKLLDKIPGGKSVNRALLYDYRGDLPDTPTYMQSIKDMKHAQMVGRTYAVDLGHRLQNLPERSQLTIGDRIRGRNVTLTPEEAALSIETRNVLDSLGKQAVDVGLLDQGVFFKNVGKYMPRLYTKKEYQGLMFKFKLKQVTSLDMSRFLKRKDIPKNLRKQMGEILKPGYPVAKGIVQLTHDIEMAKYFNGIAKNPQWSRKAGSKTAVPNGWVYLGDNKKLGSLSKAYVHPEIAKDINLFVKASTAGERLWKKSLGAWKFGKVILSPKTHARNLMSNSILSHLGGLPLWRQPTMLLQAAKAMKTKSKIWERAFEQGLLDTTFVDAELRTLFNNIDGHIKSTSPLRLAEAFGSISGMWEASKVGANKAAALYAAEEQWFKMAKFIDNVERLKMTDRAAAADATKWLFDYSELTKAQRAYREKWYGAPFATFTVKAIPRIAEAAIKTPWRFAAPAAIIKGLEAAAQHSIGDSKETYEAKKKLRPEWMQGSAAGIPNFPRVPIQDDSGREYYLNLSYIVPWGDIGESGGVGPIPSGLTPLSMPVVKEAWQQIAGSKGLSEGGGYDNFWKEPIVRDSDVAGLPKVERYKEALKKRGRHLYNTVVPTLAIDIEKGIDAYRGKQDYRGRTRPSSVVAADVFAGIKMFPVDYADQMQKKLNKLNPESSEIAREIMFSIRDLSIQRNQATEKGNDTKNIDNQLAKKVRQLEGLGKKLSDFGDEYTKIIKEKN